MTLLVAGHETTATALAWSFELLFRSPPAMERARSDARAGEQTYIDAVAKEALRLRPVVPFTGRKLCEAAELGGYELPAETVMLASIWLAHTREATFPDPYSFKPERFVDGSPDTYSWIPFGGGTRRCLGASFAQLEMRVVLRTLLRRDNEADAGRQRGGSDVHSDTFKHAHSEQRFVTGGSSSLGEPDEANLDTLAASTACARHHEQKQCSAVARSAVMRTVTFLILGAAAILTIAAPAAAQQRGGGATRFEVTSLRAVRPILVKTIADL